MPLMQHNAAAQINTIKKKATASLEAQKALLKSYAPNIKIECEIYEGSFIAIPDSHFDKNHQVLRVKEGLNAELSVSKVLEKFQIERNLAVQSPEFHEITAARIEEGIINFVNSYDMYLVALILRKTH
jgi:ribosomal protein L19